MMPRVFYGQAVTARSSYVTASVDSESESESAGPHWHNTASEPSRGPPPRARHAALDSESAAEPSLEGSRWPLAGLAVSSRRRCQRGPLTVSDSDSLACESESGSLSAIPS